MTDLLWRLRHPEGQGVMHAEAADKIEEDANKIEILRTEIHRALVSMAEGNYGLACGMLKIALAETGHQCARYDEMRKQKTRDGVCSQP